MIASIKMPKVARTTKGKHSVTFKNIRIAMLYGNAMMQSKLKLGGLI